MFKNEGKRVRRHVFAKKDQGSEPQSLWKCFGSLSCKEVLVLGPLCVKPYIEP